MIITLCGSTKFKEQFMYIAEELSIKGHIILMPNCYAHSETDQYLKQRILDVKPMLDIMHFKKIDMSECVFVIDQDNYIGDSTKKEIEYAYKTGKLVFFLSKGALDSI